MKYVRTLFTAYKAKSLLNWHLHIKAKLRGKYIMVEDDEYKKAVDLLRRKECHMIRHEITNAFDSGYLDQIIGKEKK